MAEQPLESDQTPAEHPLAEASGSRRIPQPYPYRPLSLPDCIRLVFVQPDEGEDPITCELLSDFDLNDSPLYWAISYCWLVGSGFVTLQCGDHELTVQTTVHQLLKRLRSPDTEVALWIDAICIDQADDDERSSQVQRMGRVYQSADLVMAWVGEEDQTVPKVAELLSRVDSVAQVSLIGLDNANIEASEWSDLVQFLRRPWFSRKWVLQEVCHAQRCFLRCGGYVWDWHTLQNLWRCVENSQSDATMPVFAVLYRSVIGFCTDWSDDGDLSNGDLMKLIKISRGAYTSQKIDEIYAILPLARENYGIRVDYRRSTMEVFVDAATRLINRMGLAILKLSADNNDLNKPRNFPSWVPDWTSAVQTTGFTNVDSHCAQRAHEAMGKERQVLGKHICIVNERKLHTKMLAIDEVDMVARPWPNDGRPEGGELDQEPLSRLQDWHRMLQDSYISQDSTSRPSCESYTLAFVLTLMAGHYEEKFFDLEPFLEGDILLSKLSDFLQRFKANPYDIAHTRVWTDDRALWSFYSTAKHYCRGRTFFTTTQGRMGIGPPSMLPSDEIFMSQEFYFPSVMRRSDFGSWKLVGGCYLHGWNRGELLTRPQEAITIE